jgi:hypothetical protein
MMGPCDGVTRAFASPEESALIYDYNCLILRFLGMLRQSERHNNVTASVTTTTQVPAVPQKRPNERPEVWLSP